MNDAESQSHLANNSPNSTDGMLGRCRCSRSALREMQALFQLAWPTSLSILFHYLIQPISLAFCGHLGRTQLAGVAMALSVIYITCISVGRGLAFGADTYFSQTYGSANKKKVGVYLQRSFLFGFLASFPVWAVLVNAERILLLIRQDTIIAKIAQDYLLLFLPAVPAYCWLFILMRYMLCQNLVFPNLIICLVSSGVNAALHYGLVYQAQMGIKGSAIALMLTYYVVLLQLFAYIWGSGVYRETWDGWSWECLEDWGSFARILCSSVFMTFIFWLCTEVGTFLAGILGDKEISAYSITFQVEGFAWMVPLGLGSACTARVGQYLGANRPRDAKTSYIVAMALQLLLSVVMAGATYLLRGDIPKAFTTNSELISFTGSLMRIVAIFVLLEGAGGVGVSIIRGTGRQSIGALILFVSYYVVALPVGVPLMFATHLGLSGLWWGYVMGMAVQVIAMFGFAVSLNWQAEAEKAQVRAGIGVANRVIDINNAIDADDSHETTPLLVVTASGATWRNLIARRVGVAMLAVLVLIAGVVVRHYTSPTKYAR